MSGQVPPPQPAGSGCPAADPSALAMLPMAAHSWAVSMCCLDCALACVYFKYNSLCLGNDVRAGGVDVRILWRGHLGVTAVWDPAGPLCDGGSELHRALSRFPPKASGFCPCGRTLGCSWLAVPGRDRAHRRVSLSQVPAWPCGLTSSASWEVPSRFLGVSCDVLPPSSAGDPGSCVPAPQLLRPGHLRAER